MGAIEFPAGALEIVGEFALASRPTIAGEDVQRRGQHAEKQQQQQEQEHAEVVGRRRIGGACGARG